MTFQQERLAQILKRSHTSFTCKSLLDPPAQPTPVLEVDWEGREDLALGRVHEARQAWVTRWERKSEQRERVPTELIEAWRTSLITSLATPYKEECMEEVERLLQQALFLPSHKACQYWEEGTWSNLETLPERDFLLLVQAYTRLTSSSSSSSISLPIREACSRALFFYRIQHLDHRPSRSFQEALRAFVNLESKVVGRALLHSLCLLSENTQVVGTIVKWIIEALVPNDLDSTLMGIAQDGKDLSVVMMAASAILLSKPVMTTRKGSGQTELISLGTMRSLVDRLCQVNPSSETMSSAAQTSLANLLLQVVKRYANALGENRVERIRKLATGQSGFQWKALLRHLASTPHSKIPDSPIPQTKQG